jgi:predicted phosphodiesterase
MLRCSHFIFAVMTTLMPMHAQPATGRVLVVSDIHLDPLAEKSIVQDLIARPANQWPQVLGRFSSAAFAKRGSDSNYSLMSAVLDAAAKKGPFDYVIFQGDALRHHFREAFIATGGSDHDFSSFATKTAVFVVDTLQRKFHAPVLVTFGNNDSTCGDNRMDPGGAFFGDLSNHLTVLSRSEDARSSFRSGGYYSIPNPSAPGQDIIVLNSVFWSQKYSPCIPGRLEPGRQELDWLASKLDELQPNRTAILVMHIPPGADVNASVGKCAETPFWKSQYLTRFAEILEKHRGAIRFALAGHTHRNDIRMLVDRNGQPMLAISIVSSISPVYNNDPEFSVLTYAPRSGQLSDLVTYSLDLSTGSPVLREGHSLFRSYGIRTFDAESAASVVARIHAGDKSARQTYEANYAIGAPQSIPPGDFAYYGCALTTLSESDYKSCVCH